VLLVYSDPPGTYCDDGGRATLGAEGSWEIVPESEVGSYRARGLPHVALTYPLTVDAEQIETDLLRWLASNGELDQEEEGGA
jgi:hypothetical protein